MVLAITSEPSTPIEQCQRLWRRAGIYYEHSCVLARALGDREGKLTTAHFGAILQQLQKQFMCDNGTITTEIEDGTNDNICDVRNWAEELTTTWRQRAQQAMMMMAPAQSYTAASA